MLCMYNNVDKNYDVIIPYTHNTAHGIIILLPLEISYTLHYSTLHYNKFNNHLLREGYALLIIFFCTLIAMKRNIIIQENI